MNHDKNLRTVFISAICLVLLISIFSYLRINSIIKSDDSVIHTSQVTLELEKMIDNISDGETAHRGFMLTRDSSFLKAFNIASQQFPVLLDNLQQLIKGTTVQEENLEEVKKLSEHRQRLLADVLKNKKSRNHNNAAEILVAKSTTDSLRAKVDNMIVVENDLMHKHPAHLKSQTWLAPATMLILILAALAVLIFAYLQLNKALLQAKKLKTEVRETKQLHSISTQLIFENNLDAFYQQLLNAAKEIMNADCASIQLLNFQQNKLELLSSLGFHPESAIHWKNVDLKDTSTCAKSLHDGTRVIVTDVEQCAFMKGTKDLEYYRLSQIRAVQSTPLITRNGIMLGMISTHWKKVHQPSAEHFQLFDILVRQASDLLERKQVEEKVTASEKELQTLFEQAPVAITLFEGEQLIAKVVNENARLLIGITKAEDAEKKLIEYFAAYPERKNIFLKIFQTGISCTGKEVEVKLNRLGVEQTGYYDLNYNPWYDAAGKIKGVIAIGVEVTEKVLTRKHIEETNQQLQFAATLTENIADAVIGTSIIEESYRITSWNKGAEHTYGWKEYEVIGKPAREVLETEFKTEEDRQAWQVSINENGYWKGEVKQKKKDGTMIWVAASVAYVKGKDGKIMGGVAVNRDITAQKEAQEKIKESENKFRELSLSLEEKVNERTHELIKANTELSYNKDFITSVLKSTNHGVLSYLAIRKNNEIIDFEIRFANDIALEQLNLPAEKVIGNTYLTLMPDAKKDGLWDRVTRVLNTGISETHEIYSPTYPDRCFTAFFTPLEDGVTVTFIEITEQKKQAEILEKQNEELEERNAFVETLLNSSLDIILVVDKEMKFISANEKAMEYYSKIYPDTIIGKHVNEPFPKYPTDGLAAALKGETVKVKKFKSTLFDNYFEINSVPLWKHNEVYAVMIIIHDITENIIAEDKIQNLIQTFEYAEQIGSFGSYRYNFATQQLTYSDNLYRILGCEPLEFPASGESFLKFTHPDDVEYVANATSEAFKQKHISKWEYRMIRKDKKIINVRGTGRLITHSDGSEWMIGTLQDITEEKQNELKLKESEEKFYDLFNLSPVCKTLTDMNSGKIILVNDAFTNTFGYSREEALNKTTSELGMLDSQTREATINELKANGKIHNKEIEFIRKSGEKFFALTSAEIITINNQQLFLGAYSDISDRKQAEIKVEQKNAELEKMNKELQSFAYISSHDLQEPLRKIQTFATRIIEKEEQNLSENGKDNFKRMQAAAGRMQTLIEDLLLYSRTNTEERKFEKTDLTKIVNEVKEELNETITEKQATIETMQMCNANIIPFQFRQLMHNLIGNSLKFAQPETPPHIKIKSSIAEGIKLGNQQLAPEKRYCHISITDNGIGFEPEYSEKIFEVFQRLHTKNEFKGTGIGLSIVKKIVENHNGFITANAELNKGARFDIYIPA